MVLMTKDRIDQELLKQLYKKLGDPQKDPHSGDVKELCDTYPAIKYAVQRNVPMIRIKSRGWVIRLYTETDPATQRPRVTNFAATKGMEAVWARPKSADHILGANSLATFDDFVDKHYDVLVYYYKSFEPESLV